MHAQRESGGRVDSVTLRVLRLHKESSAELVGAGPEQSESQVRPIGSAEGSLRWRLPRQRGCRYPSVTSPLCAENAASTCSFSSGGTLKCSRVRPSSAATSSNSSGDIRSSRWASSKPSGVLPGLVAEYWNGPPATLQTQSVRMNFSPGSRARLLVCHSRRAGFLED